MKIGLVRRSGITALFVFAFFLSRCSSERSLLRHLREARFPFQMLSC